MTAPSPRSPGELPAWFEPFCKAEFRVLARVVMAAGGTLQEAEDAAQDTFVEMLRRVMDGERIRSPRPYARKSVLNRFADVRRRDRRGHELAVKGGYALPEAWQDLRLEEWEGRQWVDQLLAHCPPAQQKVMRCVLDGLSGREIADLLGKTPATVRKNHQLARRRLRPLVGQEYQVAARGDAGSDVSQIDQKDAR
ncbi:Sigma-70 region 2 [Thermomonospora echinospora]|uniref:Sigma-70 region 2 n=1 Tax=Thermomonospora echinospora TaxID=1992 RepID=A0A1H6DRS2_9ACTN|nr:sigma-70 family RNA polymerase sigma factor [Thermomonospora echinospora]SEG87979.1 Sigma-70 region 2 [Thermomonospora echinospora]